MVASKAVSTGCRRLLCNAGWKTNAPDKDCFAYKMQCKDFRFAGQMNRVESGLIAFKNAGKDAQGCAMASDAFFPFPDNVENAAKAGVAAIVQPGGSKKDDDVVACADRHGIAMVFTGKRHFKH